MPFPILISLKQTRQILLAYEATTSTREESLDRLCGIGWTRGQAEALLQASYLLLSKH